MLKIHCDFSSECNKFAKCAYVYYIDTTLSLINRQIYKKASFRLLESFFLHNSHEFVNASFDISLHKELHNPYWFCIKP